MALLALGCTEPGSDDPVEECGPTQAVVDRVVDGDTVVLDSGERVRYLMIDTPESTNEQECWGAEAKAANEQLVEGEEVQLSYDVECEDAYGRLLAYVERSGQVINELMVERGHACVLHISPNGDEVLERYEELEYAASQLQKGLWGACDPIPCGD